MKTLSILIKPIHGGTATYYSIDLLRGFAAFIILVFHFTHFFGKTRLVPVNEVYNAPLYNEFIHTYGADAVQLFWAISGFVFMHVYAGRQDIVSSKEFFINRMARLYPLHIITLIYVLVIQTISYNEFGYYNIYKINDVYHFLLNIFFASAWGFARGASFNNPIWSVSVEVLIYFAFFLFFKKISVNLVSVMMTFLTFVIAFLLFKTLFSKNSMILLCGVYFFAGATAYSCRELLSELSRKIFFTITALMFTMSSIFIYIVETSGKNIPRSLTLILLFVTLILFFTAIEDIIGKPAFRRVRWIGDITYSSYLWHTPLQMTFLLMVSFGLININIIFEVWFFITYLGVVCLFSWFSFKYVEKPFQKIVKKVFLG